MSYRYGSLSTVWPLLTAATLTAVIVANANIEDDTDVLSSKTIRAQRAWADGINISTPVQAGQMTYLVSVRLHSMASDLHRCTGTLIDDRHVITGAKCVVQGEGVYIMAGAQSANELDGQPPTSTKRKAVPAKVSSMKLFSSGRHKGDVAILRLSTALPVDSPHIGYIQLPNRVHAAGISQFQSGESCVLSAWGRDPFRRREILFYTNVTLIAGGSGACRHSDMCVDLYPRVDGHCRADPGSPIICNDLFVGVLGNYNAGTDCVHGQTQATPFVRIEDRLNWIREVVNTPDELENTLIRHRSYYDDSSKVSATIFLIGLLQCLLITVRHEFWS